MIQTYRDLCIFNCSGLKESRCVYESAELNECAQAAYFHDQPAGVSVPLRVIINICFIQLQAYISLCQIKHTHTYHLTSFSCNFNSHFSVLVHHLFANNVKCMHRCVCRSLYLPSNTPVVFGFGEQL